MAVSKVTKKRLVTSFSKLTPEQQQQVKTLYPMGYDAHMMRIDKPNGDFFCAVPYETEDIYYLVKIDVKVDSANVDDDKFFYDDVPSSSDELSTDGGDESESDDNNDDDISI